MGTELANRPSPPRADVLRALAIGAAAGGALALGAVAVGALAIGRVAVRRGTIKSLHIGDLTVDRLRVREQLPAGRSPSHEARALPPLRPYAPPVAEGEPEPADIPRT